MQPNSTNTKQKKYFALIFLFVLSLTLTVLPASAAVPGPKPGAVPTDSFISGSAPTEEQIAKDAAIAAKKISWDRLVASLKTSAALSFRQGVKFFLRKIAADTATWIASGGRGQQPLFETQGWGAYLMDAADQAAGVFLDGMITGQAGAGSCECRNERGTLQPSTATTEAQCTKGTTPLVLQEATLCKWTAGGNLTGKGGIWEGLNLCAPNLSVRLMINLGLTNTGQARPRCTFSTLRRNWSQAITQANFIPEFNRSFDPGESDLSTALTVQTNLISRQWQAGLNATLTRLSGGGFKDVAEKVNEVITFPGTAVRDLWATTVGTTESGELSFTGNVIADAVDVFTKTLASTLLNNLLTQGFTGGSGSKRANLNNYEAEPQGEGVLGAKTRFAQEVRPDFSTPGRYDVLSKLVSCDDSSNVGPTDCVINDNFRTAITQKLTISEAVEKGLINGDAPFGFIGWNPQPIEPSYIDGIPYRTILILRKYRIVPVGWELAARYIQHFGQQRVTLRQLLNSYDTPPTADAPNPFYRLVDPNWVLVPPDAFCRLQGPGPKIISQNVSKGTDVDGDGLYVSPGDEPPTLNITRDDNYCADEQTCIQRDSAGNCQFYGYCTEEKRTWDFGRAACQPQFSSCATLSNVESGASVSYLLNTVDFDGCDASSVGCRRYGRADLGDGQWSTAAADSIYLNGQTKTCDEKNAGCRAFVRTGAGIAMAEKNNLLRNASFEVVVSSTDDSPQEWSYAAGSFAPTKDASVYNGERYLHALINDAELKQSAILTGPLSGQTLGFSFYAKQASGAGTISYSIVGDSEGTSFTTPDQTLTDTWTKFAGTKSFPADALTSPNAATFTLRIPEGTDIDALTLTLGQSLNTYAPYATTLTHLKRAPDYRSEKDAGYTAPSGDAASCRPQGPASEVVDVNADQPACAPYARYCLPQEVGCARYTPANRTAAITAVSGELCPSECVGFDTYTSGATFFEQAKFVDLIPTSGKRCSAAAVGCDEFTNLDKETSGGEAREYYQQLQFCEKPGGNDIGTFYTWEGSEETGFQLRVFQLKKTEVIVPNNFVNSAGSTGDDSAAPCTHMQWNSDGVTATCADGQHGDDTSWQVCNENTYEGNPDCRQFYNEDGKISYRLLPKTVSVTDACRPLRKTDSSETDCANSNGWWNTSTQVCIYQAVPNGGRQCNQQVAGCREYSGGTASSYRTIINDTFEAGTAEWKGGQLSAVSSIVGGHSYEALSESIEKKITVNPGSSTTGTSGVIIPGTYIVTFWARTQTGGTSAVLAASLSGPSVTNGALVAASLTSEWQQFHSDPVTITVSGTDAGATLTFTRSGNGRVFIDNIKLDTTTDTHYLIKNSWRTPLSCYAAGTGQPFLGCQQYQVSDGTAKSVWQFGAACHDKVVGCEAVIDTQNTTAGDSAPFAKTFNDPEGSKVVTVPADSLDFIVNDEKKHCAATAQGCELLGTQSSLEATAGRSTLTLDTMRCAIGLACSEADLAGRLRVNGFSSIADKITSGVDITAVDAAKVLSTGLDPALSNLSSLLANCYQNNIICTTIQPNDVATLRTLGFGDLANTLPLRPLTKTDLKPFFDYAYRNAGTWRSASLLNNPDAYDNILCSESRLQCSAYTDESSTVYYFKDPDNQVCEYHTDRPISGWYKHNSTATRPDCNRLIDINEPSRVHVAGAVVSEPLNSWVGTCPVQQSSCREIIDPRSDDGRNVVVNGSFLVADNDTPRSWKAITPSNYTYDDNANVLSVTAGGIEQDGLTLRKQTLYVLSAEAKANADDAARAYLGVTCFGGSALKSQGLPYTFFDPSSTENFERFSVSFYVKNVEDLTNCNVQIGQAADLLPSGVEDRISFTRGQGIKVRNVSLREASIHYELASQLDTASCAGIVNNASCVLASYQTNFKTPIVNTFDADTSPTETKTPNATTRPEYACIKDDALPGQSGICRGTGGDTAITCFSDNDCQLHYDANLLVKVQPSRECGSWLSCKTSRTVMSGNVTRNICLAVEGCEQLDDRGQCIRTTIDVPDRDLTYSAATVDQLKDRSGYSSVGYAWTVGSQTQILQGYISPGFMNQVGQLTNLLNSNFELPSQRGDAVGWVGWNSGQNFRVINNPVTAQSVGIVYPREGRAFLEVNANHPVPDVPGNIADPNKPNLANYSGTISVAGGADYVLSADINTVHFSGKSAEIRVYQYDGTNVAPSEFTCGSATCKYYALLDTGPGSDWVTRVDKFRTEPTTRYLRLQFAWFSKGAGSTSENNSGDWYIDDIKLQPALQYQKNEFYNSSDLSASHVPPDFPSADYENGHETLDYKYASQSCRLYPEESALSCQYNDDNGLRHRGKLGYCLTRDPQNSNNCLQWWPVDNVVGEDTEQDRVGYQGPVPLYYCAETVDNFVPVLSNGFPSDFPAVYYDRWKDNNTTAIWSRDLIDEKSTIVIDLATSGNSFAGALKGTPTGGIIDKPGPCNKKAVDVNDIEGCEIGFMLTTDFGNTDENECAQIFVSNSPSEIPPEGVSAFDYQLGQITHAEYRDTFGSCSNTTKMVCAEDGDCPSGETCKDAAYRPYFFDLNNVPPGNYRYLKIFAGSSTEADGNTSKCQAARPVLWVRPNFACTTVLQTVASDGSNKAYANRVSQGSSTKIAFPPPAPGVTAGYVEYGWEQDSPPFGAAVPPPPADDPSSWDTSTDPGQQALFTIPKDGSVTQQISRAGAPYSCRQPLSSVPAFDNGAKKHPIWPWPFSNSQPMCSTLYGELNTNVTQAKDLISQLFVESYGSWQWQNDTYTQANLAISPPSGKCADNQRSATATCAVVPSVTSVVLTPVSPIVNQVGSVTLGFTAIADPGQEPITRYIVDWGDGSHTVQTGLRLASRPLPNNPISLIHSYAYDDVVRCLLNNTCGAATTTSAGDDFIIKPRVQILDNWGWCNAAYEPTKATPEDPLAGQSGFNQSTGAGCGLSNNASWQSSADSITLKTR